VGRQYSGAAEGLRQPAASSASFTSRSASSLCSRRTAVYVVSFVLSAATLAWLGSRAVVEW
jgi:hypothetical protein